MHRMLLASILVVLAGSELTAQSPPPEVVGYYTSWSIYRREFPVTSIPAGKLTRLHYAFANVVNGRAVLGDPVADIQNIIKLRALKTTYPKLKVLISVGGWTWSSGFSDAILTTLSRQTFAASCVGLVTTHGFDGVEIDWEYPVSGGLSTNKNRPEDKQNFTLFMTELRRQLVAEGAKRERTFLLAMTAPSVPSLIQNMEVAKLHAQVDSIAVMAHSFHGPWAPLQDLTGFSAALYPDPNTLFPEPARSSFNVAGVVRQYLDLGVPRQKLHLGLASQGIGFAGVIGSANGLYGVYSAKPAGTWSATYFDYTDLVQNYIGKNGYTRYWHADARVPWLYNSTAKTMITYEDPRSIREKMWFVRSAGLGGTTLWELSADRSNSLLGVVQAESAKVPGLRAPTRVISAAKPGKVDLFLESDATRAGRVYYTLGSLSGTTPGFAIGGGVLPLNFDTLTTITIWFANGPLLPGTTGTLDTQGAARAGFNAATLGPLPTSLVGTRLSFAAWVLQTPTNIVGESTNPVDVFIKP